MKKILMLAAIVSIICFIPGCVGKEEEGKDEKEQAYVNEGNGEEKAVNTLQVGSKYRVVGPLEDLKDAVVEILGDNYWPDTLLSGEELAERTGISDYMYDNFWAEYQRAEAGIDMMIIIEAKEEELDTVEKYLNDYREMLLKIYEQQPQNKAKVFASRIEIIENYVCYVQLGADISSLVQKGEDEMVASCQQENERALDIIEKKILNQ